jgi:hypothetical protein
MCLAISTPAVLPSVGRKTSAPRTCLTPLNTSPAPSPPSRAARASLGAGAVHYAFTVTDFHRLPLAGLPAHPSRQDTFDCRTRRPVSLLAYQSSHDNSRARAFLRPVEAEWIAPLALMIRPLELFAPITVARSNRRGHLSVGFSGTLGPPCGRPPPSPAMSPPSSHLV